jgi:hypothetical protein
MTQENSYPSAKARSAAGIDVTRYGQNITEADAGDVLAKPDAVERVFEHHLQQKKELKIILKIAAETGDENSPKKHKRKTRGVEVTVSQISEISFAGFFTHRVFKLVCTESVYASFQYCVSLKRGPPMA